MNEMFHYILFKNLSKGWEKYVFRWKKLNFEHIGNSAHTTEVSVLGKTQNIYIIFDVLPKQTCELKALQASKVYIQQ